MLNHISLRLPLRDFVLACDCFGDRAGRPMLFVHGYPLSGAMWDHAARHLPAGWYAIVPDLRGFGRSDATETVTMADFAADLAAVLDALGERRPVVLVGLSMGGIIALEFFRQHRRRLAALGLIDTRAVPETDEGKTRREMLAQRTLAEGPGAVVDGLIDQFFGPGFDPTEKEYWRAIMLQQSRVGVAAASRALAARADSRPTLAQIDCPTLLVVGEHDAITPPDMMRGMHEQIPGSLFEVVTGAGHGPPIEQPSAFSAVLNQFIQHLPTK